MTVLGPAARPALLSLSFIYRDQLSKLWECGKPAAFAGFPRTVERGGSRLLAFQAFHGPASDWPRHLHLFHACCRGGLEVVVKDEDGRPARLEGKDRNAASH